MLKTNILIRITQLHPPHLLSGSIGRLIITENDFCPARQRRNTSNGILNISLLILAGNNDRYSKIAQGNRWWNHTRDDHLRHAELAQKWQACAKMIQKSR